MKKQPPRYIGWERAGRKQIDLNELQRRKDGILVHIWPYKKKGGGEWWAGNVIYFFPTTVNAFSYK